MSADNRTLWDCAGKSNSSLLIYCSLKATKVSVDKCVSESVQLGQFHGAEGDDDNLVKLKNGNAYGSSFILLLILSYIHTVR